MQHTIPLYVCSCCAKIHSSSSNAERHIQASLECSGASRIVVKYPLDPDHVRALAEGRIESRPASRTILSKKIHEMTNTEYALTLNAFQTTVPVSMYLDHDEFEGRAKSIVQKIETNPDIVKQVIDGMERLEDMYVAVARLSIGDLADEEWRIIWRLNDSDNYGMILYGTDYRIAYKTSIRTVKIMVQSITERVYKGMLQIPSLTHLIQKINGTSRMNFLDFISSLSNIDQDRLWGTRVFSYIPSLRIDIAV